MSTSTGRTFKIDASQFPSWATNDRDLRLVIVTYLEHRACGGKYDSARCYGLNPAQRLARAQQKLHDRIPGLEKTIDKVCNEYVELKAAGGDPKRLKRLQIIIEGLDTSIIIARRPAPVIASIVYRYFREGMNSVQCAAAVGLRPPGVRSIIMKICRAAASLGFEPESIQIRK